MKFPERFSNLPEYAFPRLRSLLAGIEPGGPEIAMSIGEPRHAYPDFVADVLSDSMAGFAKYPPNDGSPELRGAISAWISRRYHTELDPDREVITLNGTREGLFNACLAICPEHKNGKRPNILIPNPFYQVYAVAAAAVNANPVFLPCTAEDGFLPNFASVAPEVLAQTAIVYICSPSNPQGAVADETYWLDLFKLAEEYDFRVFADECYSEIYRDLPPSGALEVARANGVDPERVTIFHSLSKRSNLPGLRSGFAAGGPQCIAEMKQLRAYSGAPLPLPLQNVAARVWADEAHVIENRAQYCAKYEIADAVFADVPGYHSPNAGFFLWLPVDDGEAACVRLWRETGVKVLPGAYLSRDANGANPGKCYIRVALVAENSEMERGLKAIRDTIYT